jgi:hypothetical protein
MAALCNRLGVAGIFILVTVTGWSAAQSGRASSEKEKTGTLGLDAFKNLPPGAIIVVCDDLKTAQQLSPKLFVLTPKQYQDMLDKIEQSRNKELPKESVPGECRITGKVDAEVAQLHAEFRFLTERDGEPVLLACRMGQATAVSLDGNLPVVHPTERGLVVLPEKKGEHVAKLDLELNLRPPVPDRPRERGFELDLPGAAVTSLDLDVPEGVKEATLGVGGLDRSWSWSHIAPARVEGSRRHVAQQLGAATSLELSWKGPAPATSAPPFLTAQGTITVRLTEQVVATEAEWTLKPSGQPVSTWRLHVPPNAQVSVKSQGVDERLTAEVEPPERPGGTLRVVRLKEPTLDPIHVVVQVEQKRRPGPAPIGPFAVEGAVRQRGAVLIGAPAEAKLRVFARGALAPREVAAEDKRKDIKVAFTYWSVPTPEKAGQPFPPLLEVEADSSQGAVEARVDHFLQCLEENWKLETVLRITPLAAGVDTLVVQLPANYRLLPGTPRGGEPAISVKADTNPRVAEIKLDHRATQPFRLTLEGVYPAAPAQARHASLELPQLQQVLGRGPHKIVIQVADDRELESRERDPTWDVERTRYNRQTWTTSDRLPERVEIAWQPHRQELSLGSVADVALSARLGQVVQQIWGGSAQSTAEVRFRAPDDVGDVEVLERGEWDPKTRTVKLSRDASRNQPLRLRYSFPIRAEPVGGAPSPTFTVPLFVPVPDARCQTKIRINCGTGALVERVAGPWEEVDLEPAPDEKRLPSLVLRGERPEMPPRLHLTEATALATTAIERALIRVSVGEQGQQAYHASLLLNASSVRHLDFELPTQPATSNVRFEIGGLPVNWGGVEDQAALPVGVDPSRVARVRLGPGLARKIVRVDVWFQFAAGQLGSANSRWTRALPPLQSVLYAPRLCGDPGRGSVRWQVMLPADWVPLSHDGSLPADLEWTWRGWLVGTRPAASTADLERWLTGSEDRGVAEEGEASFASVVDWRTDLGSVTVYHAPRQAWLLACSIGLLAVFLALYFARTRRLLAWVLLAAVLGAVIATGIAWPGAFSALVYGCEPGVAALIVVGLVQWTMHRRYRRHVVFLPGFKRVKAGGSPLIPNGGGRSREPSTVDAVPQIPSNQWTVGSASPSGVGRTQLPGSSQTKVPPA